MAVSTSAANAADENDRPLVRAARLSSMTSWWSVLPKSRFGQRL
jgi:hypothetical protein